MSVADQQEDNTKSFDQAFWEDLWTKTLRDHGVKMEGRKPNAILTNEVIAPPPGRALDAGCGHGAETLWLAMRGWNVTAVDFSTTALAKGKVMADAASVSDQIDWVQADLATWSAPEQSFDLVICLYVHVAGSMEDMIRRMAKSVAPGGTLLLLGNSAVDPTTVLVTGQTQIQVEDAVKSLDSNEWEMLVAEERAISRRVDSVIIARRRTEC